MTHTYTRIDNPPVLTLRCSFLNARQNKIAETTFGITRTDLATARSGKVFAYNGRIPSWCKAVVTDLLEVDTRTSDGVMCTLRRSGPYPVTEYIYMPL